MVPVTIGKLDATDYSDWLRLWLEWQHYLSGTIAPEVNSRTWQLLCDEGSGLVGLIARRSGEAVGFAHASLTPFAWAGGPILYLQDLFVTARERGGGVGEVLLKEVYKLADEMGAAQVFWLASIDDAALQRFYDRHALRTPYIRFMRHRWPWFEVDHR